MIIPSFGRAVALDRTLRHLARQTFPPSAFEVIVVDDGSPSPLAIDPAEWPFRLRLVRQPNAGATAARNRGASLSESEVLVFVDDDVALQPPALAALVRAAGARPGAIVLGCLTDRPAGDVELTAHPEAAASPPAGTDTGTDAEPYPIHFTHCLTGLLALTRRDFERLGGFRDPTGGWPNWDDVDFGYRAHLAGFQLLRLPQAAAVHWDAYLLTFEARCDRWWRAGRSAVRLFQRYPDLYAHLPMFGDKAPIDWRQDSIRLIGRKLARRWMSSSYLLWLLRRARQVAQQRMPRSWIAAKLDTWIIGGAIYNGCQSGLQEYGWMIPLDRP